MPEHAAPQDTHHQDRDVSTRGVLITGGTLAGILIITVLVCWGLFARFRQAAAEQQVLPLSLAGSEPEPKSAFPRLEGVMREEARQERLATLPPYASNMQRLNSYGWVNQQEGIAHMPIDQAMKLIVEQNLLPSDAASSSKETGQAFPSNANSGRGQGNEKP